MTHKPMKTLPDYLRKDLTILSVGLNPSLPSVEAGFYFANPRNRFWRGLNQSRLISETLVPSVGAQQTLFEKYSMGFTDVVKRPSANASALRAADYRKWSPVLKDKIIKYNPRVVWFHGKLAWQHYLRRAEGVNESSTQWGLQDTRVGLSIVFVTPNPSPANAAFSLQVLVEWYNELADLVART